MDRNLGKGLLKAAIGLGLIFWVLRSRMVDFTSLGETLMNPASFFVALGFLSCCMLLQSFRWHLLLKSQDLTISFRQVVELTMIGLFFNTFMPGAVGGDLIKGWYIARREPTRKTRAVFTVVLDRALGLAVFLGYASIALLIYSGGIFEKPEMQLAAWSVWGISLTLILLAAVFFSPRAWRIPGTAAGLELLRRNRWLGRLAEATLLYRSHLGTILFALTVSALSITLMTLLMRYLGGLLAIEMSTAQYFFIVPMALTASALPILPGGIGVGQVAFFTLFLWSGVANPDLGGTLCTLYQVYVILFNCIGAVFYLRYKREPGGLPTQETLVEAR